VVEVVEVVVGEGLEVKKLYSEMVEVGAVPEDGVSMLFERAS
jgi:hypothetical protein